LDSALSPRARILHSPAWCGSFGIAWAGSAPAWRLPDTLRTCTRRISLGGWQAAGPAGANTIELTRRLAGIGLHPGTYRLTVSAANGGQLASPVSLPFYVARSR
jgi:hypothetical protein